MNPWISITGYWMNLPSVDTDYMPSKKKEDGTFIGYTGFHHLKFDADFVPGVEIGWRIKSVSLRTINVIKNL